MEKTDRKNLEHVVRFRLDSGTYELLREMADRHGLHVSAMLRFLIHDYADGFDTRNSLHAQK